MTDLLQLPPVSDTAARLAAANSFLRISNFFKRKHTDQLESALRPLIDDLVTKLGITAISTEEETGYNDEGGMYVSSNYAVTVARIDPEDPSREESDSARFSYDWAAMVEAACGYVTGATQELCDGYADICDQDIENIEDDAARAKAQKLYDSLLLAQTDAVTRKAIFGMLDERSPALSKEPNEPWYYIDA